jgi:hypothetical protein
MKISIKIPANQCPFGFEFGDSHDQHNECDDCPDFFYCPCSRACANAQASRHLYINSIWGSIVRIVDVGDGETMTLQNVVTGKKWAVSYSYFNFVYIS